jgi:hypothetical protein
MEPRRIRCPECKTPVRDSELNRHRPYRCSGCDSGLEVEVFPAYFRKTAPGQQAELIFVEGETACFYHAGKKAVIPCQACGRFLCGLCDCDLNGEHFCPLCLETGKEKGRILSIENSRVRYDMMALLLATLPLLIFYFTFLTAPAALFVAIRYWNTPRSLIQTSRVRLVVAIVLATMQTVGWGIGIYLLIASYYA